MSDLTVKATLTADGKGFAGAVRSNVAELDALQASAARVNVAGAQMAANSNVAGAAMKEQAAAATLAGQGLKTAAKEAEGAANANQKLEGFLAHVARALGVSREQSMLFRASLADLPAIAESMAGVMVGGALVAGIATLIAAEQSYEASIAKVDIALQAHGLTVGGIGTRYLDMAKDIASAADVSTRAAREMETSFVNSNLSPDLWKSVSAMARDYAAVLGVDTTEAAAKAAESLEKPYDWAKQLTEQYGLLDEKTLQHIRYLVQSGQEEEAQKIVTDAWAARIKNAADQTTGWAWAWNGVSTAVSNAWDKLGKVLFPGKDDASTRLAQYQQELALAQKGIGVITPADAELGMITPGAPRNIAAIVADIKKAKQDVDAAAALSPEEQAKRREAFDLSSLVQGYGPGSFDEKIADLKAQAERIKTDYAKGIKATDASGNVLTEQQALARNGQELARVQKEQRDALLNLNEVEKAHVEKIKELIAGAPQLLASGQLEVDSATGRVKAYEQGTLALEKFNDAQSIQKTTLPYLTALTWAHGTAAEKLRGIIASLTEEEKKRLSAEHALAAMQDVQSQFLGLSGTDVGTAVLDAQLELNKKNLTDWRDKTVSELKANGDYTDEWAARIEAIYGVKLAGIYRDDLQRRKDWESGVKDGLKSLEDDQADWASKSRSLVTDMSREFEDNLVEMITQGKMTLGNFFEWFVQQLVKLAYEKYMASTMNSIFGGIVSGIGDVLGVSSASTTSSAGAVGNFDFGVAHSGGVVGALALTRDAPMSVFSGAQRYHGGGLVRGEVPIIAREGERVQTETEQLQDLTRDQALVAALQRPAVVQLPGRSGSSTPSLHVSVVNNHSGAKVSTTEPKTDSQGNLSFSVIVDQVIEEMSYRNQRGTNAYTRSLEQTHAIGRTPA